MALETNIYGYFNFIFNQIFKTTSLYDFFSKEKTAKIAKYSVLLNNLINKYLNFDLWSEIRDINGVFLKRIAGSNQGHLINSSINRVKKYIDKTSNS